MSSHTPVQSLTTMPPKPQYLRRTSVSSQSLACDGVPLISLNDAMSDPVPAFTAARNGGRYTFQRSRSETLTTLYSRPASAPPYAAKCLVVARIDVSDATLSL